MVKRGEIYCPRPRNATIFDLHITSFLSSKPKHQFSFPKPFVKKFISSEYEIYKGIKCRKNSFLYFI